ncbi:Beta-amyrin 28-monooxygenase [Camellia lanceoleosa]|uniref:Beta-amyrin 28-monooxygenase n=1 Tax=Camellia lanceoleosa TaxID=1840588 RepID=A0ACC0GHM2_9ERIC|nr:Beta-amyrin 28-monooxygenase [Camellia lanceoleosa]
MEFLYLSVILAFLSIFITIFSLRHRSNDGVKLPPGIFGWPIIGESIEFLFGKPENFVNYRMKKYSREIFKTKIFGEKIVVICGPNGNKFLFSNERKIFTGFLPHSKRKLFLSSKPEPVVAPPVPPPQVVAAVAADDVKEVIRTPGFFKPEALSSYLGMIDSISQQHLKTHWEGKDELKVYPLAKTLTLSIACRIFLGMENPDRIVRLVHYFDDVTLGLHSIMVNFPGTNFYRAGKAADAIRRELMAVVRERRAAMVGGGGAIKQDILSHMIVVSDPIGKGMGEAEIADKMMGLLVAGYANVAVTISFFMKFVGESPDIYNKILSEQLEISKDKKAGELLDWNDMSKMKYSWNVMCEVMRLVPPQQGTFREVLTDFTYAGYTIPKGWKVYWTVNTTNKNSKYFRDPEKFDPSRYEGGEAPAPYTYVPFGGGPRLCPGKEYARLVVLTFIHNVVKKYKWEVLFPKEKVLGDMVPMPEKGVPIRLHPH